MDFINHSNLAGKHALLSASKYAWIRYSDEKLEETIRNHEAHLIGSRLHEFAKSCIDLKQRLPRTSKTLNMYVNDAIGFRMQPEQVLYHSEYIFGTADAISFRKERGSDQMVLRIHDLKTGEKEASFDQLMIYAAMFCLEYQENPAFIDIELRLYQNDAMRDLVPDLDALRDIMAIMVRFSKRIEQIKSEVVE